MIKIIVFGAVMIVVSVCFVSYIYNLNIKPYHKKDV